MKSKHPADKLKEEIEKERGGSKAMQFCFAYYKDLEEAYAFYCSRYRDISYNDFLHLGLTEFNRKIASIPESEPLYRIMASRSINIGQIKDKEQKKYWQKLKQQNKIPDVYLPRKTLEKNIKKEIGGINLG